MEDSPSVRVTRSRTRRISHTQVISESQKADMKTSETKLDAEEPSEVCTDLSKGKAEPLAESQIDGDVSEPESTCSSVSGLQTPLFIRITRRRQIVIPCTPETSAKNRPSRKNVTNESSNCQDHDDISEAESCSSGVSGTRIQKTVRKSRRQQVKGNVSPVCEVQAEEVSDAESWCSGVSFENSAPFKRVTRSMGLRLQAESTSQAERKSNVLGKDTETPECINTSETIVISDSEESTVSDLNAKEAPSLSSNWIKEHLSPNKTKCLSEPVASNDLEQIFSSSTEDVTREDNKNLPAQEILKNNDDELEHSKQTAVDTIEIVQSPEEIHDQSSEKPIQVSESQLPSENSGSSPCDPKNLEQPNESSGKATVSENKKLSPQNVRQSCLHKIEEIIDNDDVSEVSSPTNKMITSQIVNRDDCRPSSRDNDGSLEEVIAESSSCATKARGDEKDLFMSLLTSEESENNNLEKLKSSEIVTGDFEGSSESPVGENQSNSQELFVIDKTPGLDSHKDYYFEEKQSEDSSEVEESEEEFVDEDEDELNANSGL